MTPWVKRLLIANVAVFVLLYVRPELRLFLAFWPRGFLDAPWTIVTYMFVHAAGLLHIMFNMLVLFFFGTRLELQLGSRHFLGLYFAGGIFGALFSFVHPYIPVVGASGAMFGLLLAFARYWPHETIYFMAVIPVQARMLVMLLAVGSVIAWVTGAMGGIAHWAHLGGFAGGYLYMTWYDRRRVRSKPSLASQTAAKLVSQIRQDAKRWEGIDVEELHEINRMEVERLLKKIRERGAETLSADERAFMDRMSEH